MRLFLRRALSFLLLVSLVGIGACDFDLVVLSNGTDGPVRVFWKVDGVTWSDASYFSSGRVTPMRPGAFSLAADGDGMDPTTEMYNLREPGMYPIGVGPRGAGASA